MRPPGTAEAKLNISRGLSIRHRGSSKLFVHERADDDSTWGKARRFATDGPLQLYLTRHGEGEELHPHQEY
jgi:hypothetical protein